MTELHEEVTTHLEHDDTTHAENNKAQHEEATHEHTDFSRTGEVLAHEHGHEENERKLRDHEQAENLKSEETETKV
jgi:hypothetical protein